MGGILQISVVNEFATGKRESEFVRAKCKSEFVRG